MIGLLLLAIGLCALVTVIIALHLLGDTRSAADPDKETPPAGWIPFPPVPPAPPIPGRSGPVCVECLHVIPDGETVWMHAPTGEVWHVRCRERYMKERRTTLWEG